MDLDAVFASEPKAEKPEALPPETPAVPEQAQAPEPVAPEQPPAPTPAEPERDDKGRFVPLDALKEERSKRQELERRIGDMEARNRPAVEPQAIPDPYDDPAGYQAYNAQLIASHTLGLKFELSEAMARDKHGEEAVTAAMDWGAERARNNPGFREDFLSQRNPIDWVVRQQKQDIDLSEYSKDPVAFARRILEANGQFPAPDTGAGMVPAPAPHQAPRLPTPPRSIASAPSGGGQARDIPTGPMAGLDALFKG